MAVDLSKAKAILDRLKGEREKREAGGGSTVWAKITVGDNQFRLLPPWPGSDLPMKEYWYHYITKPDNTRTSVVCPMLMKGQPCPICEMSDALRQSQTKEDKDAGYEMRASSRWFINVIDRRDEAAGPKVLGVSAKGIIEDIMSILADPDFGDISDINKGTDIVISRTGTDKNSTKYKVHGKRSSSVLGTQDQVNAWIPAVKNLDLFGTIETYENLVRIMEGQTVEAAPQAAQAPVAAPVQAAVVAAPVAPVQVSEPVQQAVVAAPVVRTPVAPAPVVQAVPAPANADKNAEVVAKVRERIAALKAGKK